MFSSFEGEYRQKPVQSLRGASKSEDKKDLIHRTQLERQNRQDLRQKKSSTVLIQAAYRSYRTRKYLMKEWRKSFDGLCVANQKKQLSINDIRKLTSYLCQVFDATEDGDRLVTLCQHYIQRHSHITIDTTSSPKTIGRYSLQKLLVLCLRYLRHIATKSLPIAVPMRMLEIYTSSYRLQSSPSSSNSDNLCSLCIYLIQNGYFTCMRTLLCNKVPESIDTSPRLPTPVASSIYDLIIKPIHVINSASNPSLRYTALRSLSNTFFSISYTEQIAHFLLPAFSHGAHPLPFTDLLTALLPSQTSAKPDDVQLSPWLLHSVMFIGHHRRESLNSADKEAYITLLSHLMPYLPLPTSRSRHSNISDDSDSDDEHSMQVDETISLQYIRSECLKYMENTALVQSILLTVNQQPTQQLCQSVCQICSILLSKQFIPVHKSRLLYSLAFSVPFIRYLWQSCKTVHVMSATGTKTYILNMLSTGLPMSRQLTEQIIPLLAVFSSLFTHSLLTLDDTEFYNIENKSTSMPFTLREIVDMSKALRDACLGIVDLAHPDYRHSVDDDYSSILHGTHSDGDTSQEAAQWAYLFKVISGLVKHLYNRDMRRTFCPHEHWLTQRITIQYERPTHMYRAQPSMFVHRRFGPGQLRSNARAPDEEDGPPLSNKEIRKLVVLTEIPFVVPFEERVRVLQKLISDDKDQTQGDIDLGPFTSGTSIHITARRNYIYEDAFDKLSPTNESNLKLRMRVKLINAAGVEEVGVDGGGLFREFLNELLKTGFDPNRGFFQMTEGNHLYPNPKAQLLDSKFTDHYYFLGRMLGKALYENMLVELPFAQFFLSKILSRHGTNLDIHHLSSLDRVMYENLISLKNETDVSKMDLDFTTVSHDFGQTTVIELKPGGADIPLTNENRIEYVHLMADYLLNKQIRHHCNAFRQGMDDVIDLDWLCMFDHHELQILISGAHTPIDIHDLRRHTNYSGGYEADHPVITLFWRVVQTFTDDERRQLLKFVTSCSRPPLLGFKDLYPAFCVHHAGQEADRLPTASTCMNLLKLPEFKDEHTLRNKLVYAIKSGAGFELS